MNNYDNLRVYFENNLVNSLVGTFGIWISGWYFSKGIPLIFSSNKVDLYYPMFGAVIGILGINLFYYYYVPKKDQKEHIYQIFSFLICFVGFQVLLSGSGSYFEMYVKGILSMLIWSFILYKGYCLLQRRKERKLQTK